MSEIGFISHPPPEPDFWIYFAKYLRNTWVQWAIVFVPFILFALYLKLTMPSFHVNEKEHSEEQFQFRDMKEIRKRRNTMSNNSL
ncbi:hypothetical protein PGSY75_0612000 [Plasmodium gaboni]|uniref:Uncharacterized protein n=1 Tax=Plasmodium gaboni TaxID=647221 RepID=A0A151LRJ7_9APIC|nr:hypothetical protein PGSY75_0612000 [Plasmodium gaboni]XP_028537268.1 conserved Plasmodium protein, unknown function [Plasmodium sp. gorilla clade G2]SOV21630.1 conserved Plasmodium protein, unknown function [Plasmodium sp. DRC-Itaito]KYO01816.1 hypothetical protein PGSY75_0612000 [Plasmodium gaboni]SOV12244.1 conserved Plasmodium protein, unknown function [Plasmodium gaboni]SOV12509.1 conserved Plasmodium protein, unknown function [Plasmodium sp. gorilla clade G2]